MNSICCINGTLSQPVLPLRLSHVGVGVFETLRLHRTVVKGRDEFFALGLDEHFSRLLRGIETAGLKQIDRSAIQKEIDFVARSISWGSSTDARLRVVVLKYDHLVWIESFPDDYFNQCRIGIATKSFLGERSLPSIKSCSALVCHLAHEHALQHNAQEALLVDRDGIVREGAWSNFFWIDERSRIRTPATEMLPGITRRLVVGAAGGNVIECDVPLVEILARCQEAFVTQATRGIVPVLSIDQIAVGNGGVGAITSQLQQALTEMVLEPLVLAPLPAN